MLKSLKTSISFAKNLLTVGAFKETSPKTVKEICSKINPDKKITVVEFGMGHGNMTRNILDSISKDSSLISFEINTDFCKYVEENIKDKRLKVVNDSALNFQEYTPSEVDNFIISIPFTFLKNDQAEGLVKSCFKLLKSDGTYSQVVYREKTLMNAIGERTFEKKTVKSIINEKIFHISNDV